jgi:hypothetical protein
MIRFLLSFFLLCALYACKKTDAPSNTGNNNNNGVDTSLAVYRKIYGATSITTDGVTVTIKTNGTPDHKSVYFPQAHPQYEAFSGTTFNGVRFVQNPNRIITQSYTFKIPKNPQASTNHPATPLGPIGVFVNGVPLFNQYAGPNQPLTGEIVSFDQSWGHPAPGGLYHYHVEPLYLTEVKLSKSALMGFLLDGFPVYGPQENNAPVTNAQLDSYHGHTHPTTEYPNGIYHYHITNTDPYINGSGFYGTPGTVSR